MAEPRRVVNDSMIGLKLPDFARHSVRVATVLGHNPGPFTGPGTNTYIVGTGRRPLLLDAGAGVPVYEKLLPHALKAVSSALELERVVCTHAHADHIGGIPQVQRRFGAIEVLKQPWPGKDEIAGAPISAIGDGATVTIEGATLRAIHTPGH